MKNTFKLFLISSIFLLSLAFESKAQLSYYSINLTTNNNTVAQKNTGVLLTTASNIVLVDTIQILNNAATNATVTLYDNGYGATGAQGSLGSNWFANVYAYTNYSSYLTNITNLVITTSGVTNYFTNRVLFVQGTTVAANNITNCPVIWSAPMVANTAQTWTNLNLVFTKGVLAQCNTNGGINITIGYRTLFAP